MTATATKGKGKAKAEKAEKAERAPRTKLIKPHRQVLATLSKLTSGGLSRRAIAERVGKHEDLYGGRIANETKTYAALVENGHISEKEIEVDEGRKETIYSITAAGRKALKEGK